MTMLAALLLATAARCGTERWPVKVGADAEARSVVATPKPTTIAKLIAFPAPANVKSLEARAGDVELTTFEVEATITLFKTEADGDYHIVISDDQGDAMIAEIPRCSCVPGSSPFHEATCAARAAFEKHFNKVKSGRPESRVVISGVGFFDFIHGQTGHAPNGIELHPVLSIEFTKGK